jgi:peptidoglycan/LPS O-acetylase OafA/YrhL
MGIGEQDGYRADIDGLRAAAVLAVVLFHAFPALLPGGFLGVDIFFVISGFLIGGQIIGGLRSGRFRFIEFYARRARRIFPALAVVLAATMLIGWFALLPSELIQLGRHTLASALFVQNILLWNEAGYFDIQSGLKPLLHIWSLGVEEQYYLVFPMIAAAAHRMRLSLAGTILVILVLSLSLCLWTVRSYPPSAFYLPQNRFWELLAGAFVAALPTWRPAAIASGLGVALIAGSLALMSSDQAFPNWSALTPVVGTSLIIAARQGNIINRVVGNPVAAYIGRISYPWYLWHWPLLAFLHITEGDRLTAGLIISAVVLSFLLAAATYALIERPIRFHARLPAAAISGISALCVAALVGWSVAASDGFPSRLPPNVVGYAEALAQWGPEGRRDDDCIAAHPEKITGSCRQNAASGHVVALVGDSHANSLWPGLGARLSAVGIPAIHYGAGGCLNTYNTRTILPGYADPCVPIVNDIYDTLISSPTIKVVVLAGRWAIYQSGRDFDLGQGRRIEFDGLPADLPQGEMFDAAVEASVARLLSAGKEVILIDDWPELGFSPAECVDVRPLTFTDPVLRSPCSVDQKRVQERQAGYRTEFDRLQRKFPTLRTVETNNLFCDGTACSAMSGDKLMYRDNNHLSLDGSALAAKPISEVVTTVLHLE